MTDHHPDLSTKAGRKAWRHDMRMVAVRPRRWGLRLLALGALLMALPTLTGTHSLLGWSPSLIGMVLIAGGVPLLLASIWLRRRHQRQRMTGRPHLPS